MKHLSFTLKKKTADSPPTTLNHHAFSAHHSTFSASPSLSLILLPTYSVCIFIRHRLDGCDGSFTCSVQQQQWAAPVFFEDLCSLCPASTLPVCHLHQFTSAEVTAPAAAHISLPVRRRVSGVMEPLSWRNNYTASINVSEHAVRSVSDVLLESISAWKYTL